MTLWARSAKTSKNESVAWPCLSMAMLVLIHSNTQHAQKHNSCTTQTGDISPGPGVCNGAPDFPASVQMAQKVGFLFIYSLFVYVVLCCRLLISATPSSPQTACHSKRIPNTFTLGTCTSTFRLRAWPTAHKADSSTSAPFAKCSNAHSTSVCVVFCIVFVDL